MSQERRFELPVGSRDHLACRWSRPAEGTGATVTYLHGFGSSQDGEKGEFFRRAALESGLGFLSFDFRGHGGSSSEIRALTLSRCLEDLEGVSAFCAAQGGGSRILLGSSMGALVGLWHAALHPDGIAAGLYVAPAIGLRESFAELVGAEGMRRWREEGTLEVTNELGTFAVGWEFARDLESYPGESLARIHRVPSVLFQGQLDDRVSWRRVADFAAAARGEARLRLFPQGDHRLLQHRAEIWDEMQAFVAVTLGEPPAKRRKPPDTLEPGNP